MKKYLFLLFIGIISSSVQSQTKDDFFVNHLFWSDKGVYERSPIPIIKGQGELSDSLSLANGGSEFYEYNGEYYKIENWADYYYWFTQKFDFLFQRPPVEYKYYYLAGNDFAMFSFVFNENYLGTYFPTTFRIDLDEFPAYEGYAKDSQFARNKMQVRSMIGETYQNKFETSPLITSKGGGQDSNNIVPLPSNNASGKSVQSSVSAIKKN